MATIYKKPSFLLYFTESTRSFFETIIGFFYMLLSKKEDLGKGRVVMVIPGLLTSDFFTFIIRNFLVKKGFKVYGWEYGLNLGNMAVLPIIQERIEGIHQAEGKKINLIGWSMGGLFAREIAQSNPEIIEHLVTIGSPYRDIYAPNHVKWVFDFFNKIDAVDEVLLRRLSTPTIVSSTSIYSKKDGIVPWEACKEEMDDSIHKSISVNTSHFGMGAHMGVQKAVLVGLISYSN